MLSSLRVKQQQQPKKQKKRKERKKKCPTQLGRADALEALRAEGSWGAVSPQWGSPEVKAERPATAGITLGAAVEGSAQWTSCN